MTRSKGSQEGISPLNAEKTQEEQFFRQQDRPGDGSRASRFAQTIAPRAREKDQTGKAQAYAQQAADGRIALTLD